MRRCRRVAPCVPELSAFAGYRFPPEVIVLAVRWYLRFGLSCRDLEELLAERGVDVDHVTLYRWVQRFTPVLIDAARPCRHAVGSRWFVDETYLKVAGVWCYVYRAVDQHGQAIDVYVSVRRDITAARKFFTAALSAHGEPDEVVTDLAHALAHVIEELLPDAFHNTQRYGNNRAECDHGQRTPTALARRARPDDNVSPSTPSATMRLVNATEPSRETNDRYRPRRCCIVRSDAAACVGVCGGPVQIARLSSSNAAATRR